MKKTAALMIVTILVLVSCLSMVTFAFWTNKDALTILELPSTVELSFALTYDNTKTYNLTPSMSKSDNMQTAIVPGQECNIVKILLNYEVDRKYDNMHLEVSGIKYTKDSRGLDPLSTNVVYMNGVIEFAFATVEGAETLETVQPKTQWHTQANLTNKSYNIGAINGAVTTPVKGKICLFVKLNANSELVPPSMNGVNLTIQVDSAELDPEPLP